MVTHNGWDPKHNDASHPAVYLACVTVQAKNTALYILQFIFT